MDEGKSKRIADQPRERFGMTNKKKNAQEKKTKSETTTTSCSSTTDPSIENIMVVGKGCGFVRSKSHESGYRLHECHSETAIYPLPDSQDFRGNVPGEGIRPIASNTSFISAKSDLSDHDALQKKVQELEDEVLNQNVLMNCLKKQLGHKQDLIELRSISTETNLEVGDVVDYASRIRDMEKKITAREKKIKDLNRKIEEYSKVKENQAKENKGLTHQVNLLNRQLQSMYELIGTKNWNHPVDPTELARYKTKASELEALISNQEDEKKELMKSLQETTTDLEAKERELNSKTKELADYKNKSTLELCKLINQIDFLQKEAKAQSEALDAKIIEAQKSMDDEIVSITQKLEDQYQKDVESAIEKFRSDFERLANLPKSAIEKLLQLAEPNKIDLIAFQKEWDRQQTVLETKIASMQSNHNKEIMHLKDSYETKIIFLKTQVESLASQLKERKEILDIFESELMTYKSNSSMNLLKASSRSDDISCLKELYTAEIFSQKQVHKLEMNIFEEKVKTLSEEILYNARNEEIHLHELESAKKMAYTFREKYEELVTVWEERVEKDFKIIPKETNKTDHDTVFEELKNVIQSLKKSEELHEERLKKLQTCHDDKLASYIRDIEIFQNKFQQLEKFQQAQSKLDATIQELIKSLGLSYTKTVEALLTSHVTELGLKQLEIFSTEKLHSDEIIRLKNSKEEELSELRRKINQLEDSKQVVEQELSCLKQSNEADQLKMLREKLENTSLELLKCEGMIAMKEETEDALTERIRELEEMMKTKEENCRKELEDLAAKFLEIQVLSSAKDDLAKELEDKLNDSETLLKKSSRDVDALYNMCCLLQNNMKKVKGSPSKYFQSDGNTVWVKKANGEELRTRLLESIEKLECWNQLEEDNEMKILEEKIKVLNENKSLKKENNSLLQAIAEKEKNQKRVEILEKEKSEVLQQREILSIERDKILEKNEALEENIKDLNDQVNFLMTELANNKAAREETFSFSLQEVRVLYQEEQETASETASTSTVGCQVEMASIEKLRRENEELKKENEILKIELRDRDIEQELEPITKPFHEEMISKFRNIQNELSEVVNERNELLTISESLEKEREYLKEEIENLKEENYIIQESWKAKMKLCEERGCCSSSEDSALTEYKISKMQAEMRKLSDYVKTLSDKLDSLKRNNESLLSESREHLMLNQNLVTELEEAWTQRYEIEDQLSKVRRQNALLNLHRNQLEETNKRISNLVTEGKPSVVSWIKIHETVENIVDEVLALKTSFSDSGSVSSASIGFDVPKTTSELKLMAESLHTQLQNKTILCDELMVQKDNLEKELKGLEDLLKKNDSRIMGQKKHRKADAYRKQPVSYIEKRPEIEDRPPYYRDSHLSTLNRLKRHLENQVELEEVQFRETLEHEIKGLRKEMRSSEENLDEKLNVMDDERNLALTEMEYEKEVLRLSEEFEEKLVKLRKMFGQDKEREDIGSQETQKKYSEEIDKLQNYFKEKWTDLEKRYQEIYSSYKQKRLNDVANEQRRIIEEFLKIFQNENFDLEERKNRAKEFLSEILRKHWAEMKSLQSKYKESLKELEDSNNSEVEKLKSVVLEMKEKIQTVLRKEEESKSEDTWRDKERETLLEAIRAEYNQKLEKEKKKLNDTLEEIRQKHEKEISTLEEFWTEKLSECETKRALIKAAGDSKTEEKGDPRLIPDNHHKSSFSNSNVEQSFVEELQFLEEKDRKEVKSFITASHKPTSECAQESFCPTCLSTQTYYNRMEVKTDDDKLEIVRERDALRSIVTKLLNFISQYRSEFNNTSMKDFEETMYKSIHLDLENSTANISAASGNILLTMDLSTIIQEINDNSLLNSSDQVRVEVDKCLKQLKKDAANLLALSCPQGGQNLCEMVKKLDKEKTDLEAKVSKVEEMQNEIKKEIGMTKDRLSQWERHLEVISEGYGEEVVKPKKPVCLSDLKEKIKLFLADQPQEINLLDEICKEGDRMQEQWKLEKLDLQQQIDVADKQLHSFKKFLEEQAAEREQEREAFDREISQLKESLKAKERDNSLQNRTNRENGSHFEMSLAAESVEALETQVKELTCKLYETERNKTAVEGEFQNAVKKIWSLREVIQDLEVQLAEVCERELILKKKVDKLDGLLEDQSKVTKELKEELDTVRNQTESQQADHIKNLEEELLRLRCITDQINPETMAQLKTSLREIEVTLTKNTKDLEQLHVSSANVSCSSPSEDVSIRDHLDATRCSTPDEMSMNTSHGNVFSPLEEIDRLNEKLARHTRAEEVAIKCIIDLKMQLKNNKKAYEEVQTERDVLLEKVDVYLKENSSLKVRLEEQRCNAGLLQKQLNANLESQVNRLEVDVEKLNDMCVEKDKQLKDMKEILENTTKALKIKESEVLNKSKEESTLISTLKTDLGNALTENQKLEEKLGKMKEKLRDSMKMPALIDSMIDEKNAEIDRLEKEVSRLTRSLKSKESSGKKAGKRTRFSEPDSFGECLSSISNHNPSVVRNCSDSYSDWKNSPLAIRQPFYCSSKLESVSSIGPLQLSPRGTDPTVNWKTSSPIVIKEDINDQSKPFENKVDNNYQKMFEESKLQSEIEKKQRLISELQLEIDVLKRQLVEVNQELVTARSQSKEIQNSLELKEEEVRTARNNEKSLLMTIESLKKNHIEEVEELQNKLSFEHGKVAKVYDEIRTLEEKKIEIEEAFYSLKEDYNEKILGEQKTTEALVVQVTELERKNEKLEIVKGELEKIVKNLNETSHKLNKEIESLKKENENLRVVCSDLTSKTSKDADVQVENDTCDTCRRVLEFEVPHTEGDLKENIEKLKEEFEKVAEVITERDFSKREAFLYAMAVKRLLLCVLTNFDDLYQELESHRKKVMECSVDDLACKVQRELVLSAKLDRQLLSSIDGFVPSESALPVDGKENCFKETGGGDSIYIVPSQTSKECENFSKTTCSDLKEKIADLENERNILEIKISEQHKIIKLLEAGLYKEKERTLEEKERCVEDAKIMKLLRVNLEKGLLEIKSKNEELKRERQEKLELEKEIESLRKPFANEPDPRKISDLNQALKSQKEKLVTLKRALDDEKKKSQDLKLSLEQIKMERVSKMEAQKFLETDLAMLQEQKDNLKSQLVSAQKLLNARNVEIGLLKRKINLQEIDIKALTLSSELNHENASEISSETKPDSFDDVSLGRYRRESTSPNLSPSSLLVKMKKLNTCVQHHVKESNEMGEVLLSLSQETEQMREFIKKLEDNETKLTDQTLVADFEMEKKLWELERSRLVTNMETWKGEYENLKRGFLETCKSNEVLKMENAKLKKEIKSLTEKSSNEIDNIVLQDKISHLTRKRMRAESHQKALIWQKRYLEITLKEYQRSEEEAWRKVGRVGNKKKEKSKSHKRKFKVVALAVLAVFRMKFIVKRWHPNSMSDVFALLGSQPASNHKLAPIASVLNIYNEPVNPLSYQTQNIIRHSTSKVLRTPPSRDPGPRSYSLDSKIVPIPECLDTFNYLNGNLGTANVLP